MARKLAFGVVALLYSISGLALDLEREHLLDLYHGVQSGHHSVGSNSNQRWANLSTGLAPSYEDEYSNIEFSPLDEEARKTQIGVFSGNMTDDDGSTADYAPSTPSQFGQNEDERYGVFIKHRF